MKKHYIETKVDLFDPQLVRCVWDKDLRGKRCFAADELDRLRDAVNSSRDKNQLSVVEEGSCSFPFRTGDGRVMRYAYYDPYYEMKLAYLNGARIQYINRFLQDDDWHDCDGPCWDTDTYDFRVKPEPEHAWRPFKDLNEMLGTLDHEGSCIWLEYNSSQMELLVTGPDHQDDKVRVDDDWLTMQDLFDKFTWAGNPVGVKEMEVEEEEAEE